MLAGLGMMHQEYGKLPWAELCAEAIRHARDGFGATPHYRHFAAEHLDCLRADRHSAAAFLAGGEAPAVGAPIVQADLARTLEEIAAEGADTFYRGRLARPLAAFLRALHAGDTVAAVESVADGYAVALAGGKRIAVDRVMFATGRRPNIADHSARAKSGVLRDFDRSEHLARERLT